MVVYAVVRAMVGHSHVIMLCETEPLAQSEADKWNAMFKHGIRARVCPMTVHKDSAGSEEG